MKDRVVSWTHVSFHTASSSTFKHQLNDSMMDPFSILKADHFVSVLIAWGRFSSILLICHAAPCCVISDCRYCSIFPPVFSYHEHSRQVKEEVVEMFKMVLSHEALLEVLDVSWTSFSFCMFSIYYQDMAVLLMTSQKTRKSH